jgi:hypothetical protein
MGWGLGKNSPIVLSLGKANYEAMLDRHGQNVRWRISRKCTCLANGNRPDPKCQKCGGSGERYSFQKEYTDTARLRVLNGYIELPEENEDCEVIKVFDSMGIEYTADQTGRYVRIFSPLREVNNGEIVEVVFKQSIIHIIDQIHLEKIGNGFYRVPGIQSNRSTIEGVTYTAPGDIIDIDAVFDNHGEEVDIWEFRQDMVRLKDTDAVQPITVFGVQYIKPFKFFVLSQNLDEEDTKIIDAHQGDAISTFPYKFDVAEGDVMTVLSGTQIKKIVLKRADETRDDTIQEFFVQNIPFLATENREYTEGTDFILVGQNKIHWLCEDPPAMNAIMSITYRYFPTYRVFKNIPMLRTSENQQIPRKVVLKLFSAYSESRAVNFLKPEGAV